MRSLFLLLVVVAIGNCDRSRSKRQAGDWGSSLAYARINSQEMRLEELNKQLDSLEAELAQGDDSLPASVSSLSNRLEKIEGDDCTDREFSCGRHSGQCIFELMVCDKEADCKNGRDEEADICENKVPAGRSWKGTANWSSCLVRSNNKVHLLITSNKRVGHFPGQLYVEAAIFEEYTLAGQLVKKTWTMEGRYSFARRGIKFDPPKGSTMGIGMRCSDAGNKVAQCNFVRVSDGHVCGSVTMTRD